MDTLRRLSCIRRTSTYIWDSSSLSVGGNGVRQGKRAFGPTKYTGVMTRNLPEDGGEEGPTLDTQQYTGSVGLYVPGTSLLSYFIVGFLVKTKGINVVVGVRKGVMLLCILF